MKLGNQKDRFDLAPGHCYLNASYLTPTLRSIADTLTQSLEEKRFPWSYSPETFFAKDEKLRSLVARLMHSDARNIALVSSVSYGVETAVKNLPLKSGQNVVLPEGDFPSNVYPWKEAAKRANASLRFVERPKNFDRTQAVVEQIDYQTAVVSVPQCDWSDGTRFDLLEISKAAKRVGAALVVDVSQSLGAYPIDVKKFDPDFMFSVGYKWQLGPYGLSYLYVADRHLGGQPLENNWLGRKGSENFAKLTEYVDEYHEGARRFESGEHAPFLLAPLATEALRQVIEWGPENIHEYIMSLTGYLRSRLGDLPCTIPEERYLCGHMVGLGVPADFPLHQVSAFFKERKIHLSVRGKSVRISPHVYNTTNDIDLLLTTLKELIKS